ncbi:MAG: hypothetical protein MJZ34_04940 [Paludibacteraceae bacterium]|nr:hypothetical protein [Paludibacteraceae bacterium]
MANNVIDSLKDLLEDKDNKIAKLTSENNELKETIESLKQELNARKEFVDTNVDVIFDKGFISKSLEITKNLFYLFETLNANVNETDEAEYITMPMDGLNTLIQDIFAYSTKMNEIRAEFEEVKEDYQL